MELAEYHSEAIPLITARMKKIFSNVQGLSFGGKHLRGTLCLIISDALGGDRDRALTSAAVIDGIHAACLPASQKVLTSSGEYKPINEITPGSKVKSFYNGELVDRTVLAIRRNGTSPLYRLRTRNREIVATANHPFLVLRKIPHRIVQLTDKGKRKLRERFPESAQVLNSRYGSMLRSIITEPNKRRDEATLKKLANRFAIPLDSLDYTIVGTTRFKVDTVLQWACLSQLKKGDLLVALRLLDGGQPYKLPDGSWTTPDFTQLCGALQGDGWVSNNPKSLRVVLCIPKTDPKRETYTQIMARVIGTRPHETDDQLIYYSASMSRLLRSIGICNTRAEGKRIPSWVFALPYNQREAFVRGLADTDGSQNHNSEAVFVSSPYLARDLKLLVDGLGFLSGHILTRTINNHKIKGKPIGKKFTQLYGLYFTKNPLRKQGTFPDIKPVYGDCFSLNTVKDIEAVDSEDTFDLMIENSHNFIAEGLVVHNSLIHDDIVDEDTTRRGQASLWVTEGIKKAVFVGDRVFAIANKRMALLGNQESKETAEALDTTMDAWAREAASKPAEFLIDLFTGKVPDVGYQKLCLTKTAPFFKAAAKLGGMAANSDEKTLDALSNYAEKAGLAFQIADDIKDLQELQKETGIPDWKKFVPVLPAIIHYNGRQLRQALFEVPLGIFRDSLIGKPPGEKLTSLLFQSNIIEQMQEDIEKEIQNAVNAISGVEFNEEYCNMVKEFPKYCVDKMLKEGEVKK